MEASNRIGEGKTDLGLKYTLAAMDGMSHAAFRSICFEYGAQDATTEMVSAIAYARARKKRQPILDAQLMRRPEETRLAAQIIGCDPEVMAAAARKLQLDTVYFLKGVQA